MYLQIFHAIAMYVQSCQIKTQYSESQGQEEPATTEWVIYKEHHQNLQMLKPRQQAPSYYSPNAFLLHRINKPTMVEIGTTALKYWLLRV